MNNKEMMLTGVIILGLIEIILIIMNWRLRRKNDKLDTQLIAKTKQYDSLIDVHKEFIENSLNVVEKLKNDCVMKVKEERRLANDSEELIRGSYKEEITTLKQVIKALEKDLSENYKVISNLNKQLSNSL